MIRKIALIYSILFLFMNRSAESYINIHPYRLSMDREQEKTKEELIFYNKTHEVLRYKISVLGERGEPLKEGVDFYPDIITLKPGGTGNINFKIGDISGLAEEEHRYIVQIEQLRVPQISSKGNFKAPEGVEVYPKVKLPLRVYLGKDKVALSEKDETGTIMNLSGREIEIEAFLEKKTGKKSEYIFLKNMRLSKEEGIDTKELLKDYADDLSGKKLEISDKRSGKLLYSESL